LSKKWDVSFTVNGFLAGLVGITCPCYWVSPLGSIAIGGIAGVLVILGIEFLERLRIDDPIGAVPVHGFCGIWGTLSLGLFACGQFGVTGPLAADNSAPLTGLLYGGGLAVLKAQAIGSFIVTVATFSVALAVMYGIKAVGLASYLLGRRNAWSGSNRARYLGVSGIPDLSSGQACRDGSDGISWTCQCTHLAVQCYRDALKLKVVKYGSVISVPGITGTVVSKRGRLPSPLQGELDEKSRSGHSPHLWMQCAMLCTR
jgi:hypothetical protein